jgi:hypothetical protein
MIDARGNSYSHLHKPCLQCGCATRYKQWLILCRCGKASPDPRPAQQHVEEIWAEHERKNAELPDLTGQPTLQVAERYATGRLRPS